MKRVLFLILLVCSAPWSAWGQGTSAYTPQLVSYPGVPTGTCAIYQQAINTSNGNLYVCNMAGNATIGTWVLAGGGISPVSSLPATCTPGVTAPVTLSVPPYGLYVCTATNTWSFSTSDNAISPLAYGAKFNVHRVKDASTTFGTPTITCPNNDCNFTSSAKLGQTIYCTLGSTVNGVVLNIGTITGTIAAQSITSTGNSGNSSAGGALCAWGDDDSSGTDPLNTSWNAAANAAQNTNSDLVYQMPSGMTFTHKCLWNAVTYPNNGGYNAYVAPTLQGTSSGTTVIIVLPLISQGGTFDLTTCATGNANFPPMFGPTGTNGGTSSSYRDFTIDGLGNNLSAINMGSRSVIGSGDTLNPGGLTFMRNFTCVGFGANATNFIGMRTGGIGSSYMDFNIDGCGLIGAQTVQPGNVSQQPGIISFRTAFIGDSGSNNFIIKGGVTLNSYGSTYGPAGAGGDDIQVTDAGTVYNGYGDGNIDQVATNALRCVASAVCNINGSFYDNHVPAGGNGCVVQSAATLRMQNSTCKGNATGSGLLVASGATFVNQGGNNIPVPNSVAGLVVSDGHSVKGICTGVGTAASTLGLYGTGPNVTLTTCTSAAIGSGAVVSGSRTLQNLAVTATAAGTNGSSGLVTVLVDGVGTALVCTIGTGTSCIDGTHTVAVTDGQRVSIQFTTQTADTLAGVKAVVEWN